MKAKKVIKGVTVAAGVGTAAVTGIFFKDIICRKKPNLVENRIIVEGTHWEKTIPMYKECKAWFQEQDTEEVSIQSFDGLKLCGTFLSAGDTADRAVLCVHGFTGTGENDYVVMTKFLHEHGYHVLLVDNRAHGRSEGAFNGFGCLDREDCYRWVHWLDGRLEGKCSIFLNGLSMGAATVLMASALNLPPRVKGIVADCGFTSPKEQFAHVAKVRKGTPGNLVLFLSSQICKVLAGYGFTDCSSIEAVANTKIPVFIIHGEEDNYVPTSMAKAIYRACASKKKLWIVPGAVHAESYYLAKEEYEQRLLEFFEECLEEQKHEK